MPTIKKFFKFFAAVALVLAMILSAGFISGAAERQSPPVRIIVADAKTTHHLNLYVAKELGLFEKYRLDVRIIAVDDNAAARDMVVSGGADVFWSCPTVAIAAIANGAPIKTVAQVKKPCTSVLMV
ncbi:MAG: ABC transporter substrate-binding protein, partial [Syntrophorhabdaceae bacterium]|nr:ABC transporter substrate-binding protein [Syntrophorhabdaceae bacterium]